MAARITPIEDGTTPPTPVAAQTPARPSPLATIPPELAIGTTRTYDAISVDTIPTSIILMPPEFRRMSSECGYLVTRTQHRTPADDGTHFHDPCPGEPKQVPNLPYPVANTSRSSLAHAADPFSGVDLALFPRLNPESCHVSPHPRQPSPHQAPGEFASADAVPARVTPAALAAVHSSSNTRYQPDPEPRRHPLVTLQPRKVRCYLIYSWFPCLRSSFTPCRQPT